MTHELGLQSRNEVIIGQCHIGRTLARSLTRRDQSKIDLKERAEKQYSLKPLTCGSINTESKSAL